MLSVTGEYSHRPVPAPRRRRSHDAGSWPTGIPGQAVGEWSDDRGGLAAGRIQDVPLGQVACRDERSDTAWIRGVLWDAGQRADVLGSWRVPAVAARKGREKVREG